MRNKLQFPLDFKVECLLVATCITLHREKTTSPKRQERPVACLEAVCAHEEWGDKYQRSPKSPVPLSLLCQEQEELEAESESS